MCYMKLLWLHDKSSDQKLQYNSSVSEHALAYTVLAKFSMLPDCNLGVTLSVLKLHNRQSFMCR